MRSWGTPVMREPYRARWRSSREHAVGKHIHTARERTRRADSGRLRGVSAKTSPGGGAKERAPRRARGPLTAARVLARIESIGNRLPDPLTIFALLAAAVVGVSALLEGTTESFAQRDGTLSTRTVRSLATREGVRWMFENAVSNFTGFAPLGKVLVVMLGIGVAERSGLVSAALRLAVHAVPRSAVTAALVFAGVMSSVALDAGYIVLVPLGAVVFAGLGRHPLAGLAAAFAGVSGGFGANLFLTGLDPMLAGLTQEAARLVDPTYTVHATANYYFQVASTGWITIVGTLVTTRIVEPWLGPWDESRAEVQPEPHAPPGARERRAAMFAALAWLGTGLALALLALVPGAPLRDDAAARTIDAIAPLLRSLEPAIALLFLVPGIAYGCAAGTLRSDRDAARMAGETMGAMGAYIALAFVAAQFVAYFAWTDLGAIGAVRGARLLARLGAGEIALLLAFVLVTAAANLLMGSASAKWAVMAPVFVPMLMLSGLGPEAAQAAYRVGDSVTNIVSPLLPYLPLVIVFARRYDREAGLGTILASMLPYSIGLAIAWGALLALWIGLGLPLGPGVSTHDEIAPATTSGSTIDPASRSSRP